MTYIDELLVIADLDFHWSSVSAFYSKAAGTGKWEKSRTMDDADSIDPDCAVYRMGGISVECFWRYRVISESISGMCIFVW